MLERYALATAPRLSCPISVFGGQEDDRVPTQALQGWQDMADTTCDVQLFPGGHFFINTARELVLDRIHTVLRPVLDGLEASRASRT
jgi:surfactin synthase thioesterase subunit